jgi:hypothetical protein
MLMTILIVLILLAVLGGGLGYSRWGAGGFSPVALLLVLGIVLYFSGKLNFR